MTTTGAPDLISGLVADIKKEFDLGGYFSDRSHTERAEQLLDQLASLLRRSWLRENALQMALERTEDNFRLAVMGKPVRDMAETLAENAAAVALDSPPVPPGADAAGLGLLSPRVDPNSAPEIRAEK